MRNLYCVFYDEIDFLPEFDLTVQLCLGGVIYIYNHISFEKHKGQYCTVYIVKGSDILSVFFYFLFFFKNRTSVYELLKD